MFTMPSPAPCREKLDKVYDKLKFKRQEEAALVGDLQQVSSWLLSALGLLMYLLAALCHRPAHTKLVGK